MLLPIEIELPLLADELNECANLKLVEIKLVNKKLRLYKMIKSSVPTIESYFQKAIQYYYSGNTEFYRYSITRVRVLINDLRLLKRRRPDDFKIFRKKLQRTNTNTFWGWRFELHTATKLLIRNVEYELGETLEGSDEVNGDFSINSLGVLIECISCHVQKSDEKTEVLYKIQSAINKKISKNYQNSNTKILAIDITNLIHHERQLNNEFNEIKIRQLMKSGLKSSNWDCIFCSFWIVNKDNASAIYQDMIFTEYDDVELVPVLSKLGLIGNNNSPVFKFKPIGAI